MRWLCECRGPCRRTFDLDHVVYRYLSTMGAVITEECADREGRTVVHRHRAAGVAVVATIRHHSPAPSAHFAINP